LKKMKGKVLDDGIRERVTASSGNVLGLVELILKHFNGLAGVQRDAFWLN